MRNVDTNLADTAAQCFHISNFDDESVRASIIFPFDAVSFLVSSDERSQCLSGVGKFVLS